VIYVDTLKPQEAYRNRWWAHMCVGANDDIDELHAFAQRIGLQRKWFQADARFPHYDVTPGMHRRALACGATLLGRTEFVRTCAREVKAHAPL